MMPLLTAEGPSVVPARRRVGDAMIRVPKTCAPSTTVDEARAMLLDSHVHALLVVEHGRLLAVVESGDLAGARGDASVRSVGCLAGRTVGPHADLSPIWQGMRSSGRRRLAVVDEAGRLLGLLCLQRSGQGFCTDAGVLERALERSH